LSVVPLYTGQKHLEQVETLHPTIENTDQKHLVEQVQTLHPTIENTETCEIEYTDQRHPEHNVI